MRNPDEFDAFYKDARDRLLLQTYALTGDLAASRAAVRDSFVVAWHHWRKISRLEDPESWARPHAWSHAQRRHTGRLWRREKGLAPADRATLDALGKLPVTQRKTLLLTQLTTVSMADMAREVGLPPADAERELQTATAQFAVHRDVPTTSIRVLFEGLRRHVETAQWPRPTILRRAGAARRRTHTVAGAVAAVAALVLTGSLVTDGAGVRPTLDRDVVPTRADRAQAAGTSGSAAQPDPQTDAPAELPPDAMLTEHEVTAYVGGRSWSVRATTDNTTGDGLVMPCQRERYADPKGTTALVRTFAT
jgi:DNA-directed RNA polymerase specialized sigma24 family protein